MADTHGSDVRGKHTAKCDRLFLSGDGVEHSRSFPEVHAVKFRFHNAAPGEEEIVVTLDELSPGVLRAAAAAGLNTSIGNTFGATQDPGEAFDAASSRLETLMRGVWSSERHSGPRLNDLIEALARKIESEGTRVDDAGREKLRLVLSDENARKAYESNPLIQVHLTAVKAEHAAERVKAARERVAGVADATFSNLIK